MKFTKLLASAAVTLGLATAAGEAETARRRLEKCIDFIEDLHLAEVIDQEIEVL